MNKRHQWLLPWGFQIAGWVLIALTLIFPIFVMLTWQSIDFGSVFDKFPYGGILIMLYLGSGLIVFSREKVEDEYIGTIRTESVVISAYAAGLWFILINLLAGAVPAISQAVNVSRIPYAYMTFLEAFPDMPAEVMKFLGQAYLAAPRLACLGAWPGTPLFAFWIYIVIYKIRLTAAGRRFRNEK